MPIEIITCPIVRELDGLAMSSRNVRLSLEERKIAPLISTTLIEINELKNSKTIAELKEYAEKRIASEPKMTLNYFEIVNADTLQPISNFAEAQHVVACIAVTLGTVRLIDNIVLT